MVVLSWRLSVKKPRGDKVRSYINVFNFSLVATLLLLFGCASQKPSKQFNSKVNKVAYINLHKLVNESKEGKAAKVDIQKERIEKEAIVSSKLQEIVRLNDLIAKKGDFMSPSEKRETIEELEIVNKEYQRLVDNTAEDIKRMDKELALKVLQTTDNALEKVAKKLQLSIILKDPNVIGYLDPRVDVTDLLIKELEKKVSPKDYKNVLVNLSENKVGYINLQRLVNESKMGKDGRADIQKMRQDKQAMLTTKLRDINKLRDFINKEGAKMLPAERRAKVELVQKLYKEYKQLVADAKGEIIRKDRELVSVILEKANDILKNVAKRTKFAIILKDPNAIGYLDPKVDITDQVLKELKKKK